MRFRAYFGITVIALAALGYAGMKIVGPSSDTAARAATNADDDGGQGARKGKGGRGGSDGTAVVVAKVDQQDFLIKKHSIGWVESPATVAVRTRVDSQIKEQHVVDGQMVKAGDLLFVLDDREQQAQLAKDEATLAKDTALHSRSARDLDRAQSLLPKGFTTPQALDQASADTKSTEATLRADQAAIETSKLKLSYTKIYAPIDGRIGAVAVVPGNLVSAASTTALVTITQMNPIRVSFTLPERDLTAVKTAISLAQPPLVRIYPNGVKTPVASGPLNFLDSTVDMLSGTVTAKATLANDTQALWPGQYVDIEIDLSALPAIAVVPIVAVQPGQQGSFVYLVKPDQTIELRKVKVAATDGGFAAIQEGLQPGEQVVVDGQLGLVNGSRVRVSNGVAPPQVAGSAMPAAAAPAAD